MAASATQGGVRKAITTLLSLLLCTSAAPYQSRGFPDRAQRREFTGSIKIACVGDSITEGDHSSSANHTYPSQLQQLLTAKYGAEKYEVTNLGRSGTTMQNAGDYPYTTTDQYAALIASEWDIVVVMLGTNDAKDITSGHDMDNWIPGECGTNGAPADVSPDENCPYGNDYAGLLGVIAGLGNPRTYVMTPPPLMLQGEYDMNQTVINDDYPQLIPRIQQEHAQVAGVVDVFGGMGGSADWRGQFPAGGCALDSAFPPCAYFCDAQSCDQCHPNDVGYAHMATVVQEGIGLR